MPARPLQPNEILSRNLELRHLPIGVQAELNQLLDCSNNWREIMARVRKESISNTASPYKYSGQDIKIIEKAGVQQHRSCTEIFLSEWGTSGRVRPKLSTLFELLIDAQLFRAADFVAELLGENLPPRPANTPAARVDDSDQAIAGLIASRRNENNLNVRGKHLTNNRAIIERFIQNIPNIVGEPAAELHEDQTPQLEQIASPETGVCAYSYRRLEEYTNRFNEDDQIFTPSGPVRRLLGAGGFGSVFLAKLPSGQFVAVKVLATVGEIPLLPAQFKYEVETISRICHPNLLRLIGYSNDGPESCLLYEYVDGGNLQVRLENKDRPLPWLERIRIAECVADGLNHLQNAPGGPYIHRDVKTANILLGLNGDVKLGDFGLIRLAPPAENTRTVYTTNVVGSTAYMPEEALRGEISIKMDTYSYGVVLMELMTALPPHDPNREDEDLVMFIRTQCDRSFGTFLDACAGDWPDNVADAMFFISLDCVKDRRARPRMAEVKPRISDIRRSVAASNG